MAKIPKTYRLEESIINKIDTLSKILSENTGIKISNTDVVELAINEVFERVNKAKKGV